MNGIRICGELLAVVVLVVVGSLLGAATGRLWLSAILGMALPLAGATLFLRLRGQTWRDLGFLVPMAPGRCLGLAVVTAGGAIFLASFVVTPLLQAAGYPPPDASALAGEIQGNLSAYLLFLLPVAWGSTAFGEELLIRGFVQNRLTRLAGPSWGVVLQALLFAFGHAYQGFSGMVNLFVVGLVLGYVYVRAGRNLWPVIVAHGLIDTLGITLLYLGYADPGAVAG